MKPEYIRNYLVRIDGAIASGQLVYARELLKELDEQIFICKDDVHESWPADQGDFGLVKEEEEVTDE